MGERQEFAFTKEYKCSSIMGSAPSFVNVTNENDEKSLFGIDPAKVQIVCDGKTYQYLPGIVTFSPTSVYKCKSTWPVILEGPVNIPFIYQDRELTPARKSLEKILTAAKVNYSVGDVSMLLDILDWKILNQWDGSDANMLEILVDKVEEFTEQYHGSHSGYGSDKKECTIVVNTVFDKPTASSWVYLRENNYLPQGMTLEWNLGAAPIVRVGDELYLDWLKRIISAIPEKGDTKA